MINLAVNDYDYRERCYRVKVHWDIMVDGTRVATLRGFKQAKAFIGAIESDLGYPCRKGTQMANFQRNYRKKYHCRDINA